jgi:hypothetical protein
VHRQGIQPQQQKEQEEGMPEESQTEAEEEEVRWLIKGIVDVALFPASEGCAKKVRHPACAYGILITSMSLYALIITRH